MNEDALIPEAGQELQSLDIIRSETALSRYPTHNLSSGNIAIEIKKKDEKGTVTLLWKVSHNSEYGQPGERAYRLDTLVINRRIDELKRGGQPIPKFIKLGSLREICLEMDLAESGKNKSDIKAALLQNASAFITVKGVQYKTIDKTERTLDAGFTRYSVIFTGEKLPDGRKADAVYLILNDIYAEILNNAVRRPLDYDYLRGLAAAPQRFYEIVSYQMLPAVKYGQRAKMTYSNFCISSTMTRYFDFDHVKKQMYKIHRPHVEAKYIAGVEYEAILDEEGKPDWNIFYEPGERARSQQLAFSFEMLFNSRQEQRRPEPSAKKAPETPQTALQIALRPDALKTVSQAKALVNEFYQLRYGQSQEPSEKEIGQADELLEQGNDLARFTVELAASQGKKGNGFPEHFGGVEKILPKAREQYEQKRRTRDDATMANARQRHEKAFKSAFTLFLGELVGGRLEAALPEAYSAFSAEEEKTFRFHKVRAAKSARSAETVARFYETENRARRLLEFLNRNPRCGIPTFWQWDAQFNPKPFCEE